MKIFSGELPRSDGRHHAAGAGQAGPDHQDQTDLLRPAAGQAGEGLGSRLLQLVQGEN